MLVPHSSKLKRIIPVIFTGILFFHSLEFESRTPSTRYLYVPYSYDIPSAVFVPWCTSLAQVHIISHLSPPLFPFTCILLPSPFSLSFASFPSIPLFLFHFVFFVLFFLPSSLLSSVFRFLSSPPAPSPLKPFNPRHDLA